MEDRDNDWSPDAFARAMEERKEDPTKRESAIPEDFTGRPLGFILLAAGVLAFLFFTYEPISEALAHHDLVMYIGKLVFAQPILLGLGLTYTIFGKNASKVLGPSTRPTVWGISLFAVLILLSFVYLRYVEAYLHALGYKV